MLPFKTYFKISNLFLLFDGIMFLTEFHFGDIYSKWYSVSVTFLTLGRNLGRLLMVPQGSDLGFLLHLRHSLGDLTACDQN